MLAPLIGIVVGLLVLYMCHRLLGHAQKGKTRKVILSLESSAVVILLVTYMTGEVFRIGTVVSGAQVRSASGLTWNDIAIVLATVFGSVALFLLAIWCLKKLEYDD